MYIQVLKQAFVLLIFLIFIQPLSAADLSDAEVTIVWTGNSNVVLDIAGDRYPMRAGQEREIVLPVSDAIVVSVITPAETFVADEFLILENDSEQKIYISMENRQVVFQIGAEPEIASQTEDITEQPESRTDVQQEESDRLVDREVSGYVFDQYSFGLNLEDLDDGGTLFLEFYNRRLFPRQGENHGFIFSSRLAYFFFGGMYSAGSPATEIPTLHFLNFDIGGGYGWNLGKFTPSATFNLVAASFLFERYELSDNQERNASDSEFFPSPSDTAFIRFHAAFQPSEQKRLYLTGSLDLVGIFGDNSDTTIYAGIGFSL